MRRNAKTWSIGLVLVLGTLALYWPVREFEFVSLDDPDYITENANVRAGLSWQTVSWAFSNTFSSNWHPLTWISHMQDWQLFGENPGGHHLVNIVFHAANSLILFLFLRSATGVLWRPAIVAALFAWHPTHVESVAWISERKDVLSTFFGLLSLWAYVRFAREPKVQSLKPKVWYGAALALFALGLMSKPMLVTWPFVMLLLDYWPLGRWSGARTRRVRLVTEKLPFFAMVAGSCVITIAAQAKWHALASTSGVPLEYRIANSFAAYLKYVGKIFWPTNLAAYYPFPKEVEYGLATFAALVLLALTVAVLLFAKSRPYLLTGWFWFLGTLVPVIGFVQVGGQGMADRYLYLPSIGLFAAVVWLITDWFAKRSNPARWLTPVAAGALVACVLMSARQIPTWKSSRVLFEHALKVTRENYLAYAALGTLEYQQGDFEEATRLFKRSIDCGGTFPSAWLGYGSSLAATGKREEGIAAIREALRMNPDDPLALDHLARVLLQENKTEEPERLLRHALEVRPGFAEAHARLGEALQKSERTKEALEHYALAVQLKPQVNYFRLRFGEALVHERRFDDAIAQYRAALANQTTDLSAKIGLAAALTEAGRSAEAESELLPEVKSYPTNSYLLDSYGYALASGGKAEKALPYFEQAIQLTPSNTFAHLHLGMTLQNLGRPGQAAEQYRKLIELDPSSAGARNNLAWMLATSPDDSLRNGKEAVALARRACELTENREPLFIGTLAAAYAEAGQFAEAIAAAEQARAVAKSEGLDEVVRRNGELLELYRTGKPFRDSPSGGRN